MKQTALCAITHNIADSRGSGVGLMIGFWAMSAFTDAAKSVEGHIALELLSGAIESGHGKRVQ